MIGWRAGGKEREYSKTENNVTVELVFGSNPFPAFHYETCILCDKVINVDNSPRLRILSPRPKIQRVFAYTTTTNPQATIPSKANLTFVPPKQAVH
jgi:hypothetical protein